MFELALACRCVVFFLGMCHALEAVYAPCSSIFDKTNCSWSQWVLLWTSLGLACLAPLRTYGLASLTSKHLAACHEGPLQTDCIAGATETSLFPQESEQQTSSESDLKMPPSSRKERNRPKRTVEGLHPFFYFPTPSNSPKTNTLS